MSPFRTRLAWCLGILGCAMLGYFLARTAVPEPTPKKRIALRPDTDQRRFPDEKPVSFHSDRTRTPRRLDLDALSEGAVIGQRSLQFPDRAAMERFLARAGDRVEVLDRIDSMNALRVGFSSPDDLAGLLEGDEEEAFIYPVSAPAPEGADFMGGTPLGTGLHDWLGIEGDNSQWGRGVRIAILDTQVQPHPTLARSFRSIPLAESTNGHGTAVASVIAGADPNTPGVAPGSDLLSVGIADQNGMSDSFQLAKGILTAMEQGADIINISMGSTGDSGLVRKAVAEATAQNILIVAAAGNHGINQVSYPAANEGVIAVGAVDVRGEHLAFSNTGEAVDVSAPGYGIHAAWPGNQAILATGTSFSAPIISGAIAAVMTEAGRQPLTASEAWSRIQSVLNDGGAYGTDPAIGAGMPDLQRVFQIGVPGIVDAAIAGHAITAASPNAPHGYLETTVQNRGTEPLINTALNLSINGNRSVINLTTLAPNESRAVRIPLANPPNGQTLEVTSQVSLSGTLQDSKPSNDRRQSAWIRAAQK